MRACSLTALDLDQGVTDVMPNMMFTFGFMQKQNGSLSLHTITHKIVPIALRCLSLNLLCY